MDMPLSNKTTVHYKGRQRSVMGKISLVVGILVWIFFAFMVWRSRTDGELLKHLGGLGFLNGILAVAGTVCSATAKRETPFYDGAAMTGMILNLLNLVTLFGLFLIGMALG